MKAESIAIATGKGWELAINNSRLNERRKPFPATLRLLFRSTKQETRRFMVVQVFTIQSIRDQAEILAMYILYLIQGSSEANDLGSQDEGIVKQSSKGDE